MRGGVIPSNRSLKAFCLALCTMPGGVLSLNGFKENGDDGSQDPEHVRLVTGVELAHRHAAPYGETSKSVEEEPVEERDREKIGELPPVAMWSNHHLREAGIVKFRRPQSLPSGVELPPGVEPLPSFVCPIGLGVMKDPVSTSDGCVFPSAEYCVLALVSMVVTCQYGSMVVLWSCVLSYGLACCLMVLRAVLWSCVLFYGLACCLIVLRVVLLIVTSSLLYPPTPRSA
jgi:hypothetical protein